MRWLVVGGTEMLEAMQGVAGGHVPPPEHCADFASGRAKVVRDGTYALIVLDASRVEHAQDLRDLAREARGTRIVAVTDADVPRSKDSDAVHWVPRSDLRALRTFLSPEHADLEGRADPAASRVTSEAPGIQPFRRRDAAGHAEVVRRYANLLDRSVDSRIFEMRSELHGNVADLAARLGRLGLGPRDLVSIHVDALRDRLRQVGHQGESSYVREGRMLLLELMGQLLLYYRNFYVGFLDGALPQNPGEP